MAESTIPEIYADVVASDLKPHAHQWASLVTFSQERLVYRKALELVQRGSKCLDWGCGNGHFSYFLKRHGYQVEAYALDEEPAIVKAQQISYTRGADVVKLPYRDNLFDAAFSVGVLEHVYERGGNEAASLTELARVVKPGGLLLVFHLPNRTSWLEWARARLGKMVHERRYSRAEALSLFEGRGLTLIEHGRYHMLPRASFARVPRRVSDSIAWCAAVDASDDALAALLAPLCQNWYFVLRKTLEPAA